MTTLVPETATRPARLVRCCVTERSGAGPIRTGRVQCQNAALDEDSELPMCARHLALAAREYCRLTGGKLTILGGRLP